MPEKNLLEQKKNNLMKALNRQGAVNVPTMLGFQLRGSCLDRTESDRCDR